jgi:hypothetical protein
MFGRDRLAHGEGARQVSKARDGQKQKEARAYLPERIDDGSQADLFDDVDEEREAEHEGDYL